MIELVRLLSRCLDSGFKMVCTSNFVLYKGGKK